LGIDAGIDSDMGLFFAIAQPLSIGLDGPTAEEMGPRDTLCIHMMAKAGSVKNPGHRPGFFPWIC
jgi:hypothetical protein